MAFVPKIEALRDKLGEMGFEAEKQKLDKMLAIGRLPEFQAVVEDVEFTNDGLKLLFALVE